MSAEVRKVDGGFMVDLEDRSFRMDKTADGGCIIVRLCGTCGDEKEVAQFTKATDGEEWFRSRVAKGGIR